MKKTPPRLRLGRILSIDPRSQRLAWAYFKDGELRDCRIKPYRECEASRQINDEVMPYLIDLLDHFSPHALLVPRIAGDGGRPRSPRVAKAIRAVVREAVTRGIAVHVVSRDTVKKTLSVLSGEPVKNCDDIHQAVLLQFPELTVMVPRARANIWEPERYFTSLFKTVAMYLSWDYQFAETDED